MRCDQCSDGNRDDAMALLSSIDGEGEDYDSYRSQNPWLYSLISS